MQNTFIYFGSLFCVLGLTIGYSKYFRKSKTNTCPCEAGTLPLIQCTIECAQSSNCTGVSFDRGNNSCCVSHTLGVPDHAYEPDSGIFRKWGRNCVEDLIEEIPDAQLTASSSWDYWHGPQRARLHTIEYGYYARGAWTAASHSSDEYIQARFYGIKEVTGIATQGRNGLPYELQCVTSYKVSYSIDCVTFAFLVDDENEPEIFPGNVDWNTIVWQDLEDSFLALCVRVYPVTFIMHPSLRFGLSGCDF